MEAFATQITAEGLEACVLPTVGDEVGALTKGFSTHLALVRLLTCKQKAGEKKGEREKGGGCERGNTLLTQDRANRKHMLGFSVNEKDSCVITKQVILRKKHGIQSWVQPEAQSALRTL